MKKIERSMMIAVLIFVLVFSLGTGAIVAIQYRTQDMTRLGYQAFSYANAAANIINGDYIDYYLETKDEDTYYHQVLSYMESVVEYTNVQFFYVFVPRGDHAVYVWDADNVVIKEEGWPLGHREPLTEEERKNIESTLYNIDVHSKEGEVNVTNGEFGHLATAYAPIYDSEGEIKAFVAADVVPDDATLETIFFMIQYGVFALIVAILSTGIYLIYIKRKIAKPIKTLHAATQEMIQNLDREETMQIDIRTN
ncbi:MAG: hypothetical protein Q4C06_01275, partial [Bacillota bacterium]|nr:hypothetical protein [Bacillota bacterium]